ncbi:sensor histidine kinase [Nocardioides sp. MAHUQ-72]|uniref:sensor histidine kinase n=1 Tax=unclassified Nocardioides TaxID=2615069 RepID=UPI00360BF215
MSHNALTPVFVGLRTGLHVLVAALLVLVTVQIVVGDRSSAWAALVAAAAFAGVYLLGSRIAKVDEARRETFGASWLLALTLVWVALLALTPEAAYLVFPLFFLYLHVLPPKVGPGAVVVATLVAIVALGFHTGFTVGGVVGPVVGAGVALLIGLGYRALAREATEREALLVELVATRDQLAATEREQGVLAERARLAREIHDTVAQGLSSIQLLLHATERADADRPGVEHLRLARQTAAEGLAETRRFIRELSPPALDQGLGTALGRLAETHRSVSGLVVEFEAPASLDLPMPVQTALLRSAQGALANVVQHAQASHVRITLTDDRPLVRLVVADDGIGFDPAVVRARSSSDSFGLRAIEERVEQLGGTLDVVTRPGHGTTLVVTVVRGPL